MTPEKHGTPWQPHEEAMLIALLEENQSYRGIAKALGRSKNTVRDRAYRIKQPTRPSIFRDPSESWARAMINKNELVEMYELGWRPIHHEGDTVLCVWPHNSTPRMPF